MRTDVHRPSSPDFDPEAYDCLGVWDMRPEWPSPAAAAHRLAVVNSLIAQGYSSGPGCSTQCGHCGAYLRYAALMARADVKQWIYVGETCLAGRFESLTKAEFKSLREAAKLNRERASRAERIAALVDAHPHLAWLTYNPAVVFNQFDGFLNDLSYKLGRYGELSERQIEAAATAIIRDTERAERAASREAEKAAVVASGVKAPEGKVTVEGEVVSVKWHENDFGGCLKMTVKTDAGWLVWSTVPSAIAGGDSHLDETEGWITTPQLDRGARVRFSATLTRSDSDPLFAFAKRPTKAEVLIPAAA
jgi:hypothetical protein